MDGPYNVKFIIIIIIIIMLCKQGDLIFIIIILYVDNYLTRISYIVVLPEDGQFGRNMFVKCTKSLKN